MQQLENKSRKGKTNKERTEQKKNTDKEETKQMNYCYIIIFCIVIYA